MSDILVHFSDILDVIGLNLRCFHRTLCPTLLWKTSDMVFKMSDMSGCPTTFHIHCYPQVNHYTRNAKFAIKKL